MIPPKASHPSAFEHQPVLVAEMLALAAPQAGDRLLDATLGLGGHTAAFLEATAPTGTAVGFDADPSAVREAQHRLARFGDRVECHVGNFSRLNVAGLFSHVLFDLGVGSHQLSDPKRSFSFRSLGPFTMRYGEPADLPASTLPFVQALERRLGFPPDALDLISGLHVDELAELIRVTSEERFAGRIARVLKTSLPAGRATPAITGHALADVIQQAVPARFRHGRLHPATRTFQALRLTVNRELEALTLALPQAVRRLRPHGRLLVISFHSLEDRIVKNFFRNNKADLTTLTKKPLTGSLAEIAHNPRARSAKIRAAIKT